MNVILEGPDNAGKTTLAQLLVRSVPGVTYFHPGGRPETIEAEAACMAEQYEILSGRSRTVVDRVTAISQQVYNRDTDLDWSRQSQLDALIHLPDVVFIYCRPPNEVLVDVANFTWRPEESEEHRQKIITRAHEWVERYDEVMTRVPCLSYNWKDRTHAGVLEAKLVQALNGDTSAKHWFRDIINYGGRK